MKYFYSLALCFLLNILPLSSEMMKNLELKVELDQENLSQLKTLLEPYYSETLFQTDTYFATTNGRLKLREEEGKEAYLIRYDRTYLNTTNESKYLFYPIKNPDAFLNMMGDAVKEELQVKKQRTLYFPKPHIRVHLDTVENLGEFLEIEILLFKEVPLDKAETEMQELQNWLNLSNFKKTHYGYRELLQMRMIEKMTGTRDFNYYKAQNKVFWVIADDLAVGNFKRYDVVPCIFVEQFENGSYGIIQLDFSIKNDGYQYTAWRKLIGQTHGFKADVLLIDRVQDKLFTLRGEEVAFDSLTRSGHSIDRSYLAPFSFTGPSKM